MKSKRVTIVALIIVFTLACCLSCNQEPLHEHTFSTEWSYDATDHWHTSTCEHTDQISGKAAHTWDSGKVTKEATHTEDGVLTYTCTVCGHTKTNVIPAIVDAHTFSEDWTYDENHHWHASTCGHDVTSGKAEHTWDAGVVTKEATHTEDGVLTYTCTICGHTKTSAIPALVDAHTFSDTWSTDETYHWHSSTCGHNITSNLAEHTWDDGVISKKATHIEDGVMTYTCSVCEKTRTEAIPASEDAHSFSDVWTTDETHHWHAATCEHDITSNLAEHTWDDGVVTKEVTHTEDGEITYTCTTCEKTRTEVIPALVDAHTFSDEWTYDETYHWHSATCGHDYLVSDKNEHVLNDEDKCAVCGYENIEYMFNITEDGSLTVKSEYKKSLPKKLVIPSSVNGINVNSIGFEAFYGCTGLISITIPGSVTSIGDNAFYNCTSLSSIIVGNAVTNIGNYAFYDCYKLTNIIIPDSVTSIGSYAFTYCNRLNSITISNSVTSIGECAFEYCTGLKSVTIGNSVTDIGSGAFYGCTDLKTVTIGNSVKSIGSGAFLGCKSLTRITIPDSVTTIGGSAFANCTNLLSTNIPASVTSIGKYAFENCTSLNNVYISDLSSWCNISFYSAFSNPLCYAKNLYIGGELSSGSIEIPSDITTIKDYAFDGCIALTDVIIPDSVTSIGREAFCGCTSLKSVKIGNSVTSIEYEAFYYCTSLESVSMGNSVSNFGIRAFSCCECLTSISIPDSVTSIGHAVFQSCKSLTSITIPDSVTNIGKYAFSGCISLMRINISNTVTSIEIDAFYDCTSLTDVYVSDLSSWCSISFGNDSANPLYYAKNIYIGGELSSGSIQIPSDVKTIESNAFRGCKALTNVIIPNSVTSIGYRAFSGCTGLKSVTIGNSVTDIGSYAFSDCTCAVIFADGTTTIPADALKYASKITSVTIPNSVTSIRNNAFYDCTSLTDVYISDLSSWCNISFENASANPLYYAKNIYIGGELSSGSIEIPSEITTINSYAFYGCTGFKNVTIGDSVTSIGKSAFSGCTCAVIFADGTTTIPSDALNGASKITSVTIPDSVTSIGSYAFSGCTGLTNISIPDSVTSIGSYAFYGCTGLMNITFTGTKSQWSTVKKESSWKYKVPATVVHCSDGDVSI